MERYWVTFDITEMTKEVDTECFMWDKKKPRHFDYYADDKENRWLKATNEFNTGKDRYLVWRNNEPRAWFDLTGIATEVILCFEDIE